MNEKTMIGVDIGGTSVKIGLVRPDGEIIRQTNLVPTSRKDPDILFGEISSSIREVLNGFAEPAGLGICAPGHADPQTGVIIDGSGNVPALKHASVTQYLGTLFGLPTAIGNDGVCAARGELEFGIGREIDSFAFVALGTGIGGAIVWNRQILQGRLNEPPEFGAVVVRPGVGQSRRGITGSVEDVAGARAVLDRYARLSGCDVANFGVKELFERRSAGDADATMVINDMLEVAAQMIGTIVNLTGMQDCVLGGGISSAGPQLLDDLRVRLKKYTWPLHHHKCELHLAQCGSSAGIVGAVQLLLSTQLEDAHRTRREDADQGAAGPMLSRM